MAPPTPIRTPRPNGHATGHSGPLELLLARLEGTRQNPSGWIARCPSHDDRQASLSLTTGSDGRVLLKCHAGCTTDDVMRALGRPLTELFVEKPHTEERAPRQPATARYQISDETGALIAIHVRQDLADGKRISWRLPDGTNGLGGRKTSELPLYGIHEVDTWDPMRPVVIAEGEKATEALQVAGFQAVGTVCGASVTPGAAAIEPLRGRHVVLWPDNDQPGRDHMDKLGEQLRPIVLSLRQVNWSSAPEHGDAADTDAATVAQLIADAEWLTDRLPQPATLAELGEPANVDAWLVEGFIRPGTLIMVTGLPGASKSWAAHQLALALGAGEELFLDHYAIARPMRVLIVDEDNGEREEWRRDESLFAYMNLRREQLSTVWRLSLAGVELDQERWQVWLRSLIVALRLDVVILDPISDMHGGKELRDDPAFRSLLRFLKSLKVDHPNMATLIVHHNRKRQGSERGAPSTIEDVRGQWGQTPDVVAIMRSLGDRRIRWELLKRVPHSNLILEQQDGGGLKAVADETTAAARSQSTDDRILGAIDAGGQTAEEIRLATGLSKSGVYKGIQRLHQAHLITARPPYERVRDSDDPFDAPIPVNEED